MISISITFLNILLIFLTSILMLIIVYFITAFLVGFTRGIARSWKKYQEEKHNPVVRLTQTQAWPNSYPVQYNFTGPLIGRFTIVDQEKMDRLWKHGNVKIVGEFYVDTKGDKKLIGVSLILDPYKPVIMPELEEKK